RLAPARTWAAPGEQCRACRLSLRLRHLTPGLAAGTHFPSTRLLRYHIATLFSGLRKIHLLTDYNRLVTESNVDDRLQNTSRQRRASYGNHADIQIGSRARAAEPPGDRLRRAHRGIRARGYGLLTANRRAARGRTLQDRADERHGRQPGGDVEVAPAHAGRAPGPARHRSPPVGAGDPKHPPPPHRPVAHN